VSKATQVAEVTPTIDWVLFNWRTAEHRVYRLQKRIFKAKEGGNVQVVHNLQRKRMASFSARMLAVRKVTQDNKGKKTAGSDGSKDLNNAERLELVEALKPSNLRKWKHSPVRRVWIPKPGKTEKRPLGIPTMLDRAVQALHKLALEPEWEAVFEPNSYGFRPGRSAHDASGAIFNSIRSKAKYVLDADIAGCFDHSSHEALLEKLQTYPTMRRHIRSCLRAGVMEGLELSREKRTPILPTEEGTPPGGVVSPLLANIALHGLETEVARGHDPHRKSVPQVIRYADDFVILCESRAEVEEARKKAETWLKTMGLEMKPSKTRIGHTLEAEGGRAGFDFLGFNVRQYRVGKSHSAKSTNGTLLGFKALITPCPEAVKEHTKKLKKTIRKGRGKPQEALIADLNPQIRGWSRYYRTVVSAKCFSSLDWHRGAMLWKWAKWDNPKKGKRWIKARYWKRVENHDEFRTDQERLAYHHWTKIQRHTKVKGRASPFDGNLVYWATRLKDSPLTNTRLGKVLRIQKGQCAWCGLYLKDGDLVELDHVLPRRPPFNGPDTISNLRAYHHYCHHQKTKLEAQGTGEPELFLVPRENGLDNDEPDA
jgi:RNA-directed DNA polymerase